MRPLFLQRLPPWTLAAAWFWTRARVENTTSAGTTTSRPTPAPSSGTEAVAATRTASTRRTSAGRRAWFPEPQVLPAIVLGLNLISPRSIKLVFLFLQEAERSVGCRYFKEEQLKPDSNMETQLKTLRTLVYIRPSCPLLLNESSLYPETFKTSTSLGKAGDL